MHYTISDGYPFTVEETEGGGWTRPEYAQEEADKRNRRVEMWHHLCEARRSCIWKDAICPYHQES